MLKKNIEIINKLGLHARASSKLTQAASSFRSEVWLSFRGRRVNGKSIMGVMMLAAPKGAVVELEVFGEDEAQALEMIEDLINRRFDEAE